MEFFPLNPLNYFPVILIITIITGIISGIYPALLMSSANPNSAVSGIKHNTFSEKGYTRHALIFVQYSITIWLMITLFVVFRQLEFIGSKDLGFDKEHIITAEIWNDPNYKITPLDESHFAK